MFLQEPVIGHGLLGAGAGGRERGQFPEVGGQLLFPACAVGVSGPTPIHSSATPTPALFTGNAPRLKIAYPALWLGLFPGGLTRKRQWGERGSGSPAAAVAWRLHPTPRPRLFLSPARFPLTSASTHAGLGGLPSTTLQTLIPAGPEYLVTRIPQRLHLLMYY